MDAPTWVPPPPPSRRAGRGSTTPAWWQRWQVVLAFVVTAFSAGMATGLVVWLVLDRDAPVPMIGEEPPGSAQQWLDTLRGDGADAATDAVPLPRAELTVAPDGCGVIRSDMVEEPHGLQWTITDEEGFQVLGRNALGETRYRYFQPGTYTVVLEAWDGRAYAPISNTVTITC